MSSSTLSLPTDILYAILDLLSEDKHTLLATSLTSKSFTAHSQRLLFRSVCFVLNLDLDHSDGVLDSDVEGNLDLDRSDVHGELEVGDVELEVGETRRDSKKLDSEEPLAKFAGAVKTNAKLGSYVRSFLVAVKPPTYDPTELSQSNSGSPELLRDETLLQRCRQKAETGFYTLLPHLTQLEHLHIVVQCPQRNVRSVVSVMRVLELVGSGGDGGSVVGLDSDGALDSGSGSGSGRFESLGLGTAFLDLLEGIRNRGVQEEERVGNVKLIRALKRLKRLEVDNCELDSPNEPAPALPAATTSTQSQTPDTSPGTPDLQLNLEQLISYGPRTNCLAPLVALQAPDTLRRLYLCTNRNMVLETRPLGDLLAKSGSSLEWFGYAYPGGSWSASGDGQSVAAAVVPTIETSIFASRHTPIFASLILLRTFKFRIATADLFDWFNRPATAIKEHCRFMVELLTGSSKSRSSSSNSLPGTTTTTTTTDEGTTTTTIDELGPATASALSSVPNLALLQLDLFGSQTVDDFVSLDMEWERVGKVLMEGGGGGGGVFGKLEKVEIRVCVKWALPWRTSSNTNSNSNSSSVPGSDRRPRDLTDEALTAWMKEGPFAGLEEKRGVCVEVRNVSWKEEYYPYVSNPWG